MSDLKCFGDLPQGFERIKPFNLIIGKNNSGKSTLLDMFPYISKDDFDFPQNLWHHFDSPGIYAKHPIPFDILEKVIRIYTRQRGNFTHFEPSLIAKYQNTIIQWRMDTPEVLVESEDPAYEQVKWNMTNMVSQDDFEIELGSHMPNPFSGMEFRRIAAERNIAPEVDGGDIKDIVKSDGSGVTTIIQKFITKSHLPRDLIKKTLLAHLNTIFAPDLYFTEIDCQQHDKGIWEIYLHEEDKGSIPLSNSGSGLKTVIIVLVNTLLIPHILSKSGKEFIYGFEELENNLHPALLRSLLLYLFEFSLKSGAKLFLTTHSNVAIDSFSNQENSQIIHVVNNGHVSECRTVKTYVENKGVLDDLDIRASDILQSNCIIWVEGPSDRTYINKWIELYCEDKIKEGFHYQCVFYGGRLLSHLRSDPPSQIEDKVALLQVNRNCCLVMDSDKRNKKTLLNKTKKRIKKEIEQTNGFTWVTQGKEIENYLSGDSVFRYIGGKKRQVDQFENFSEYLDSIKSGSGKMMTKKTQFAEGVTPYFDKSDCFDVLDLRKQIKSLCEFIKQCNGMGD